MRIFTVRGAPALSGSRVLAMKCMPVAQTHVNEGNADCRRGVRAGSNGGPFNSTVPKGVNCLREGFRSGKRLPPL